MALNAPTRPARLLVFGILHLCAALIGFVGSATSTLKGDPKDQLLKAFDQSGMPPIVVSEEALASLDQVFRFQPMMNVMMVITSLLIAVAGIGLLTSAKWSVKISNLYAIVSILGKIIILLISLLFVIPAFNSFFDSISGGDEMMLKIMKASTTTGAFVSSLSVFYPILALILLNRKVVKDYLASQ